MFKVWKILLTDALGLFIKLAKRESFFRFKIVSFFVFINIVFYWIAMLIAFPELILGNSRTEYFLLQFPVGILGGLFDSLSLLVTIYMIRRAIASYSNIVYLAHLSVDIIIAFLATMWVLFVFIFSGWLISFLISSPESLIIRKEVYENRIVSALNNPYGEKEIKNIFFGVVMGFSAMLPTIFHIYLFLKSIRIYMKSRKT